MKRSRGRKRTCSHILGIIDGRAQTLARLVQSDINMRTLPAVGSLSRPLSAEEEADTLFDNNADNEDFEESLAPAAPAAASGLTDVGASPGDSDLDSELSDDGGWHACDNLPAGDSYPVEQQLHAMLGEEVSEDERSSVAEEVNENGDIERDEGVGAEGLRDDQNDTAEAGIEIDDQEEAMLELLQLCQDAGTTLLFFDKLVAILRRHGKKGFDIRKASKRQTFLDNLRKKISCPRPIIVQVGPHQVPKFDLLEQITDLLKSVIFDDVGNLCVNLDQEERFAPYEATPADCFVEVHGSRWHQTTDQQFVKDHDLEFLLPLMLHTDETGTDAFQRHPLEPLMFTLALIRRHMREKAGAWRHAGFVPKVSEHDTSLEGLQMHHDCLSAILADLQELQENPPVVELNLGGMKKKVKIILQIAFVMGDQKSQDTLCGRKKSNGGGTARVHRRCMCSSMHASDSSTKCKLVSKPILDRLRDISFEDQPNSAVMTHAAEKLPVCIRGNIEKRKNAILFIKRRSRVAREILGRTYSMHAIRNAFDSLSFGSNQNGIFYATLDDALHFCNSGFFMCMGEVAYLGMQGKEREEFESLMLAQLRGVRCSVRGHYPRGRTSKGFTNMTLLTADERVGMIFTMLLALHNDDVKAIMEKASARQQTKYMTFPVPNKKSVPPNTPSLKKKIPKQSCNRSQKSGTTSADSVSTPAEAVDCKDLERFPRRHHAHLAREPDNCWPRTPSSNKHLLCHLKKHGFAFLFEEDYDVLQLEFLFVESWKILRQLKDDEGSYPTISLEGAVKGYPFHSPGLSERISPLEECYKERLCTKPTAKALAMVVVDGSLPDKAVDEEIDKQQPDSTVVDNSNPSDDSPSAVKVGKAKKHEPEVVPVTFTHLRDLKHDLVEKHGRVKPIVKGVGNTSAILCDIPTYVEFLEISLCMHAYLHYSADIPDDLRSHTKVFDRGLREFKRLFGRCIYRGDSTVDTDTGKAHCFMHLIDNTVEHGDPMQCDSGKGERGLKEWAKAVSSTAQKQSLDTFLYQTMLRVADRSVMTRASDIVKRKRQQETTERHKETGVTKRKFPHFRYHTVEDKVMVVNRKGKESATTKKSGTMSGNVMKLLRKQEKRAAIDIWGEVKLPRTNDCDQPQLLRAHPSLDNFGGFYDWVEARFDVVRETHHGSDECSEEDSDSSQEECHLAPAKLLAFYVNSDQEECVVVHSVEWTGGKETVLGNTRLITNYSLEFQGGGHPAIRQIRLEDVHRALHVIERKRSKGPLPPKTNTKKDQRKHIVSVVKPRRDWAEMFCWWAKNEADPWPDETLGTEIADDSMSTDAENSC